MLNEREREKKKMVKNPKWNFTIPYTTLVETFLGVCMKQVCYVLSEEMSFEVFSPIYGPMLTKTKKDR